METKRKFNSRLRQLNRPASADSKAILSGFSTTKVKRILKERTTRSYSILPTQMDPPPPTKQNVSNPTQKLYGGLACNFCGSSNMVWCRKCSFCGCGRLSETPQMKYIIDMIISLESGETSNLRNFSKKIMKYAQSDVYANLCNRKFNDASTIRLKTGMKLMYHSSESLRRQIVHMVFNSWKHSKGIAATHMRIIDKTIRMKEFQLNSQLKTSFFRLWSGYIDSVGIARDDICTKAMKRLEQFRICRIFTAWLRFSSQQVRGRYKKMRYDKLKAETLVIKAFSATEEGICLKSSLLSRTSMLFTQLDSAAAKLKLFESEAISKLHYIKQVKDMFPTTAGSFFEKNEFQLLYDILGLGNELNRTTAEDFCQGKLKRLHSCTRPKATSVIYKEIHDEIDKLPPWMVALDWINYYLHQHKRVKHFRKGVHNEVLKGKKVINLHALKKKFGKISFFYKFASICHPDFKKSIEHYNVAEENKSDGIEKKAVNLVSRIVDVFSLPDNIVTKESFLSLDFDSLFSYLCYLILNHASIENNQDEDYIVLENQVKRSNDALFKCLSSTKEHLLNYDSNLEVLQEENITKELKVLCKELNIRLEVNKVIMDSVKVFENIFKVYHKHVMKYSWNELNRRLDGKETHAVIELERENYACFRILSKERLANILVQYDHEYEDDLPTNVIQDRQIKAAEEVLANNLYQIHHVYKSYGGVESCSKISQQEFLKLLQACKITNRRRFTRRKLEAIFEKSQIKNEISFSNQHHHLLSPAEFIEAIVRVAHCFYTKEMNLTLEEKIKKIIEEKILPHACIEESSSFRNQIKHVDIHDVFQVYDHALKEIFMEFSLLGGSNRGKYISLTEFQQLLKQKHLIDARLPYSWVKRLFHNIQHDEEMFEQGDGTHEPELIYDEFKEGLAALAVFRNPNPYYPLKRKLDEFLHLFCTSE